MWRRAVTHFQQWKLGVVYCIGVTVWLCGGALISAIVAFAVILLLEWMGSGNEVESYWLALAVMGSIYFIPLTAEGFIKDTVEAGEAARRELEKAI